MLDQLLFVLVVATGTIALATMIWAIDRFDPQHQSARDYVATHPPLSDDEYLALCDPSVPPHVALGVRTILSDALGVDEAIIYPEARLMADLGAE